MFLIRYYDAETATHVVRKLRPHPTEVEYPEGDEYRSQVTPDGAVVIQRPMRDSRLRRWVWKRYRPTIAAYEVQYQLLKTLTAKELWRRGQAEVTVQIWEDVTDEGGFGHYEGEGEDGVEPDLVYFTNLIWTQVKLVNVYRKTRKGGGVVVYDDTVVEFVIADDAYGAF